MRARASRWLTRSVRAIGCACLLAAGAAPAASLQVAPTSLTLQASQNADGLWLSNSGDAPVQVQVRVFRWTQKDFADVLEPSRDLVASPPMQTLAVGARQLVRVVRTGAPPTTEATYRLIVDELPPAQPTGTGLTLALRYSVPVFVAPASLAPNAIDPRSGRVPAFVAPTPELVARIVPSASGDALEISNRGRWHAQIAELGHSVDGAPVTTIVPGLAGYVLPGQAMRWPLPATLARSTGGQFTARINGAQATQPLPLADPPR